jgi:hypothetical protein
VRGGFVLRFDEIQGRLDKGGSYQLEILKLICEIADTLLYIKDNISEVEEIIASKEEPEEPVKDALYTYTKTVTPVPIHQLKKRGRPPNRR